MKDLIFFELKKVLSNKFISVFLFILLLFNAGVCLYITATNDDSLSIAVMQNIIDMYIDNPTEMNIAYEKFNILKQKQNDIFVQQMLLGNRDYVPQALPSNYAPEGYTDEEVFNSLFSRVNLIQNYSDNIQDVINDSYSTLSEYSSLNIPSNSYTCKYLNRTIELYTKTQNEVKIALEYTRGWDKLFTYNIDLLFVYIAVIMIISTLYIEDRARGFNSIIRTTKNGHCKILFTKILSATILSLTVSTIFYLENIIVIFFSCGFSSIFNAIQAFETFTLCPYIISVIEFLLLSFALRSVAVLFTAFLTISISSIFGNYLFSCISTLGIVGINYAVSVLPSSIDTFRNSSLTLCNLYTLGFGTPLLIRFRTLNFFGYPLTTFVFLLFISILFVVLFIFITTYEFLATPQKGIRISSARFTLKKSTEFTENKCYSYRQCNKKLSKPYPTNILDYEIYKTLKNNHVMFVIVLLLLMRIILNINTFEQDKTLADSIYKEYSSVIAGTLTDEKIQYLSDERIFINNTLSKNESILYSYSIGETSFDEYSNYLSDYNYSLVHDEYFKKIENHANYIKELNRHERSAWFVYDTGWKKLIIQDFDWFLFVSILLITSNVFSMEYNNTSSFGMFSSILRLTKKGRQKTFFCKILSACIISAFVFLIFSLADYILVYHYFELPLSNAPVQSIEDLSIFGINLTIFQYIICLYATKLISVLCLTIFISCFSLYTKKIIPTIFGIFIIIILPDFLSSNGVSFFDQIPYTYFMQGTPLLLRNENMLTYIFSVLLLLAIIIYSSFRKWCKRY